MAVLIVQDLLCKRKPVPNLIVPPTVLGVLGVTSLLVQAHVEAITPKPVLLFLLQLDLRAMELAKRLHNVRRVLLIPPAHIVLAR